MPSYDVPLKLIQLEPKQPKIEHSALRGKFARTGQEWAENGAGAIFPEMQGRGAKTGSDAGNAKPDPIVTWVSGSQSAFRCQLLRSRADPETLCEVTLTV